MIKHSWTGTVLTIESDSGVSSCDLKGAKGDTGARGAQGASGEKGGGVQSVNGQINIVELTSDDIGALPNTYTPPVSSVNGKTGDIELTYSDIGAMPNTYEPPITSVNSKTGDVELTYTDVGALPDSYVAPVSSVNSKIGTVNLTYSDVGAAKASHTHSYNDLTDLPTIGGDGGNADTLDGKHASDFALAAHTHAVSDITNITTELVNLIYPIGSIYISVNSAEPSTLFGGTWEQIQDAFLLAAGTTHSAGSTGGAESYNLSVSHKHTSPLGYNSDAVGGVAINGTISAGKGKAYKTAKIDYSGSSLSANVNAYYTGDATVSDTIQTMPPYLAVYMWKRTA